MTGATQGHRAVLEESTLSKPGVEHGSMARDTFRVAVKGISQEAERIKSFELTSLDGGAIRPFDAGGHIVVHMPNNIRRHYSLVNAPSETGSYRIAVLREPNGRGGSEYMHSEVHEGSVLEVSGPANLFELDENATHSVLLAGGIGITPILAMAKTLHDAGSSFELHYCARSKSQAAFAEWLASCPFADRVSFHFNGGDPAQRLDVRSVVEAQDRGAHIYFCGPGGFMDAIQLAVSGWEASRVHFESFAGVDTIGDTATEFEVEIFNTGCVYRVPSDKSLLTVLQENGHPIESVCEEGVCGTCLVDVVGGTPEHRDEVLTEEEKAENALMAACCSRAKTSRLIIDI